MSDPENQDETSGFVVESSDMPEAEVTPQEEATEEQASSEAVESEGEQEAEKPTESNESSEGSESDSNNDDAQAEDAKPEKVHGIQKRINKEVRKTQDALRRAEALEKEVAELKSKKSEPRGKEPVEDDFNTYDEYLDALDKFDSKPETKEPAKELEQDKQKEGDQGNTLTDNQRSAMAVIKETIESSEDKPSDFEAVALDPKVPITGDMLEAIAECDNTVDVMMQLGKDHGLASSIANKSPAQQMREIAKLDLTVKVVPPKPVKLTSASDPIVPVKGSDKHEKSDSEMSFAEFEAADRERNAKRKSTW